MATMIDRVCACGCGEKFQARKADVKRGWGKFLNKSHKAREQERRTGQYKELKESSRNDVDDDWCSPGDDPHYTGTGWG